MKKYFLLLFLLITSKLVVLAQISERMEIDSLESELTQLKDSARIDCSNLIAQTISNAIPGNFTDIALWIKKADSIYHYASIAYNDAIKIGYKKGIAQSLASMGSSEFTRGVGFRINKKDDSVTVNNAEKYLSRAIALAEEINNDEVLGRVYYDLSDILFFKSKRKNLTIRGEYLKKAIYHLHKGGIEGLEGEASTWLCEDNAYRGYYEEGMEYCQRSMELAKKAITKTRTSGEKEYRNYLMQQSLEDMADLYKAAGDYETALNYLYQARQFGIENKTGWEMENTIAEVYRLNKQYDSASYYTKLTTNKTSQVSIEKLFQGQAYLAEKEYNKAIPLLKQALDTMKKKSSNGKGIPPALLDLARAYEGEKDYTTALAYAREGITKAQQLGARPFVMDYYEVLSKIHYNIGNTDSAYRYLLKYISLKDSIQNKQLFFRLNNYKKAAEDTKKEAQIGFLNRDNRLKEQQLKQEAQLKKFLVLGLLGLLLTCFFVFRWLNLRRKNEKLKNEKIQTQLRQQAVELEMQALRAQMNPHFIFNCLSSINRFILKNEGKTASNYLVRFSRLIRMVLINSQKPLITLEDELQMLTIYLDMERLRFKDSFDYGITFLNTMETGNIFIPPLLLQPFCENAIWHGLMHKEGQGRLNIEFSMKDNILHCTIADNGIGLEKSEEMKSKSAEKEKSMGLKITTERLALLNREKGVNSFYQIEDLKDEHGNAAGTKIILKISFKEKEAAGLLIE